VTSSSQATSRFYAVFRSNELEITYEGALPRFSNSEYISVRKQRSPAEEVKRILLTSLTVVSFSSDRRSIRSIPKPPSLPDEVLCDLLPDWAGQICRQQRTLLLHRQAAAFPAPPAAVALQSQSFPLGGIIPWV